MTCNNQHSSEMEFNKMLETVNNFTLEGSQLMLKNGKRAPLARI